MIRALLIEDDRNHAELIRRLLERGGRREVETVQVGLLADGLLQLGEGGIDVVLLDLRLPDAEGLDTLHRTLVHSPEVPVVVLTSLDDDELALQALRRGAQDYLGKGHLTSEALVRSMRHAIERKRLELELERSAENLRRTNQELRRFASVAAQDMLAPLRHASQVLQSVKTSGRGRHGLEKREMEQAAEGLERINRLIEDLLIYVSVDYGPNGAPQEEADCEQVLAEVLSYLQADIDRSGAAVTHDPLPKVRANGGQLTQVFKNIIENAIRFCGDEPPKIHVSSHGNADQWIFSIEDNGIGIEPDYPEQIFEPFPGIGLAICKRVIDGLGGEIWVDSELGKRSTFYFTIPVKQP